MTEICRYRLCSLWQIEYVAHGKTTTIHVLYDKEKPVYIDYVPYGKSE